MLVKVNSIGRNQSSGPVKIPQLLYSSRGSLTTNPQNASRDLLTPNPTGSTRGPPTPNPGSASRGQLTPNLSSAKRSGGHPSPAQSAMAASADCKQAFHLKKTEDGHFCPVTPDTLAVPPPGPPGHAPHRAQGGGTPRSVSPQPGSTAPLYDHPSMELPVYEEPPADMEVEGGPNAPRPGSQNPPGQGQRQGHGQQTRLLPHPTSRSGSWSRGTPSETDYSPAGREGIRLMVSVEPPVSGSLPPPEACGAPERHREARAERRQTWRTLEASLLRGLDLRQGGSNVLASPECPSALPPHCQDSGYSTGPSPSLCRRSRRRPATGPGRPGSTGGGGAELDALSERLMAEVRAVVSRSNTARDAQAQESSAPDARTPLGSLRGYGPRRGGGSREDVASSSRSLYCPGHHGDPPRSPLPPEGPGRQKRTYEKVDTLEKMGLSSPDIPHSRSEVRPRPLRRTASLCAVSSQSSPVSRPTLFCRHTHTHTQPCDLVFNFFGAGF